jgi:hypothetical protein
MPAVSPDRPYCISWGDIGQVVWRGRRREIAACRQCQMRPDSAVLGWQNLCTT